VRAAGLVLEAPLVSSGSGVGKPAKVVLACATKGDRQQWLDCFGSADVREDEAQVRPSAAAAAAEQQLQRLLQRLFQRHFRRLFQRLFPPDVPASCGPDDAALSAAWQALVQGEGDLISAFDFDVKMPAGSKGKVSSQAPVLLRRRARPAPATVRGVDIHGAPIRLTFVGAAHGGQPATLTVTREHVKVLQNGKTLVDVLLKDVKSWAVAR
jgi:hypothetical protein